MGATSSRSIVTWLDDTNDHEDFVSGVVSVRACAKGIPECTIPCEMCKAQIPSSQFLDHCAAHEFETSDVVAYQSFLERKPIEVQKLGGRLDLLEDQVFHLPGFLPVNEQEQLYLKLEEDKLIQDLDSPYKINWDSKKCQVEAITPTQLLLFDIGERALAYISERTKEQLWGEIHLDCCTATGYNGSGDRGYFGGGRTPPPLTMHVDWNGSGGWVVVLALGAKCVFKYGNADMQLAKTVVVNSGDIVVLEGSKVQHGISHIYGPTPSYWTLPSTRRVAIQMRDHRKDVPCWDKAGLKSQTRYETDQNECQEHRAKSD